MDENKEERRKASHNFNESDNLARRPLQRVDPPENTENELDEMIQYPNLDNSKNGAMDDNRKHKNRKQNQEILAKNAGKKSKKTRDEALIKRTDGSSTETYPAFTAGRNEVGTQQRFAVEPQSSLYPRISSAEQWEEFYDSDTQGDENKDEAMRRKTSPPVMKRGRRQESRELYKSDTASKDSGSYWKIIVPFLCVVLAAILYMYVPSSTSTEVLNLNVTAIVSQLAPDFERQPKMSFTVIRSALKAVSKPGVSKTALAKSADASEPDAPAIILLLAAEGAEELTARLGRNLAEAVSPNPLHIRGADYANENSNLGKKKIDDYLKTLNNKTYDAVLVEDLHRIPGSIALMFHTYCDHENAPNKRVVYVMTVASESKIPKNSKGKFWDETVRTRLSKSWSDIDDDQMEPLLTRLTVGVAAIMEDSN